MKLRNHTLITVFLNTHSQGYPISSYNYHLDEKNTLNKWKHDTEILCSDKQFRKTLKKLKL